MSRGALATAFVRIVPTLDGAGQEIGAQLGAETKKHVPAAMGKTGKAASANLAAGLASGGTRLAGFGAKMSAAVTVPVLGIGIASKRVGAEYEASMNTIEARTQMASSEVKILSREFRDMALSGDYGAFSAREIASAYSGIAVDGHDAAYATEIMRASMALATATGKDLGGASYFLGSYLLKIGKDAKYAEKYINVFAEANRITNISLDNLKDYLFRANVTLQSTNITGTEATAMFGRLNEAGLSGAQIYSGLENSMRSLLAPTDAQIAALDRLGVARYDEHGQLRDGMDYLKDVAGALGELEGAQLNYYNQLLGSTAMGSDFLGGLVDIKDDLPETIAALYEAAEATDGYGAAFKMANAQMDGKNNSSANLRNSLEELSLMISAHILPWITKLTDKATDFIRKFAEMDEGTQQKIITFAGLAAAIGPLALIFGKLMTGVSKAIGIWSRLRVALTKVKIVAIGKKVIMLLKALPFLAIAGLVYYLVDAFMGWDVALGKIKDAWGSVMDVLQPVIDMIKGSLLQAWENLQPSLESIWESLQKLKPVFVTLIGAALVPAVAAFGVLMGVINAIAGAIAGVVRFISGIIGIIAGIIDLVIGVFTGDGDRIAEAWDRIWQGVVDVIGGLWDTISGFFSGLVEGIIGFFSGLWETLVGNSIVPDIVNDITEWFERMIGMVMAPIETVRDFIVDTFERIGEVISNAIEWVVDFIVERIEFAREFWLGAWEAIKEIVTNALDMVRDTIQGAIEWALEFVYSKFTAMQEAIDSILSQAQSIVESVFGAIRNTISTVVNAVRTVVTTVFNAVRDRIVAPIQSARSTVLSVFNFIRTSISNAVNRARDNVRDAFNRVRDNILDPIRNLPERLVQIGRDIIDGLVRGINNARQRVNDAIRRITDAIPATVRNILGINSPSRVFMKIGAGICAGLIDGLEGESKKVISAVYNIAEEMIDAFDVSLEASLDATSSGAGFRLSSSPTSSLELAGTSTGDTYLTFNTPVTGYHEVIAANKQAQRQMARGY